MTTPYRKKSAFIWRKSVVILLEERGYSLQQNSGLLKFAPLPCALRSDQIPKIVAYLREGLHQRLTRDRRRFSKKPMSFCELTNFKICEGFRKSVFMCRKMFVFFITRGGATHYGTFHQKNVFFLLKPSLSSAGRRHFNPTYIGLHTLL